MFSPDFFWWRFPLFLGMTLGIALSPGALAKRGKIAEQRRATQKKFNGVLEHVKLYRPLRSIALVRFSPDGNYVLIQDSSGVFVVANDSLAIRLYVEAAASYPARFTSDSQSLVLVSRDLKYGRWHLPDGKKTDEKQLMIQDGCLDALLSPDGALLACYGPDFTLSLYRASTGEHLSSFPIHSSNNGYMIVPVPLDLDTAWANAFGYALANDMKPLANRGIYHLPMFFSPDSAILVAGDSLTSMRIDLAARTKSKLPGRVEKHIIELAGLSQSDQALIVSGDPKRPASLVSLSTGEVLASFAFSGRSARLATNPRYALLMDSQKLNTEVFDLEKNRAVSTPSGMAADVFGDLLAVYTEDGELSLYHIEEQRPSRKTELPLSNLPLLHCAAVSPSLDKIALAVDGEGAIFDLATGQRTASTRKFSSAIFDGPSSAVLLMPGLFGSPAEVTRLDLHSGSASVAWKGEKGSSFRSGDGVIFEYSFGSLINPGSLLSDFPTLSFPLRDLDTVSGREFWHREYRGESPIPFADPQGDDFVLGWKAKSEGAHRAAQRFPAVREAYKRAKLAEQDSFFEVCDARTGKSLSGVLVQFGGGPDSFDAAFAVGDSLFLIKDQVRISLFSLKNGNLVTRLNGSLPAASAKSNLFVLENAPGRLGVFDLQSGKNLKELIFPDEIAYAHFSVDGKRLLVLTEHQEVFILDVSPLRAAAPDRR